MGFPNNKEAIDFVLRPLRECDLSAVARIHKEAFPESALTILGEESIRRYYHWQLLGPHEVHAIGVEIPEVGIVGFCFAGAFSGALSGFLKRNWKFLLMHILFRPWLLFNPVIVKQLLPALSILQIISPKKIAPINYRQGKLFGILSIGVTPRIQRKGIGKYLLDDVEHEAAARGISHLILTVHPDNLQAIRFYEKNGWKRMLHKDNNWFGRMGKNISL